MCNIAHLCSPLLAPSQISSNIIIAKREYLIVDSRESKNMHKTKVTILNPRQSSYLQAYTDPTSPTFGNSYQSARAAGYSDQSARNFTPKRTGWMSDTVGQMSTTAISPEQIMASLTSIINDDSEPTIIKLKAMEMTMKAYNMLIQRRESTPATVTLNVDLSGDA